MHVRVLLSAANKTLEVDVEEDATVDDLREKVCREEEEGGGKEIGESREEIVSEGRLRV